MQQPYTSNRGLVWSATETCGGASAQIWAGLSIVVMWLAVRAVGIAGADFTTTSHSASGDTTGTTVPSVIAVAICALIATVAVAHAAFRRTP